MLPQSKMESITSLSEAITKCQDLVSECNNYGHVQGIKKLVSKINSEQKFLKGLRGKPEEQVENSLKSTNLSHLSGIVNSLASLPDVSHVMRPFSSSNYEHSLVVDVVCNHGFTWVKVIARKAEAIHVLWEGGGHFGNRNIVDQAAQYIECANIHKVNFTQPQVLFYFCKGVTAPVKDVLESAGVTVQGQLVDLDPDDLARFSNNSEIQTEDSDNYSRGASNSTKNSATSFGGLFSFEDCDDEDDDDADGLLSAADYLKSLPNKRPIGGAISKPTTAPRLAQIDKNATSIESSSILSQVNSDILPRVNDSLSCDTAVSEHTNDARDPLVLSASRLPKQTMDLVNTMETNPCDLSLSSRDESDNESQLNDVIETSKPEENEANYKTQVPDDSFNHDHVQVNKDTKARESDKNDVTADGIFVCPPKVNQVNLDITTLISLVSNLCHDRCHFKFLEPVLNKQAEEERKQPLLPKLKQFLEGKDLIACDTAIKDFNTILDTVGGPTEKERARQLLDRVQVVPDDLSDRISQLDNSCKIKHRTKVIFGTGDKHRAVTVTANTGFVRAATNQGANIAVYLHPSRALTEQKERTATSTGVDS